MVADVTVKLETTFPDHVLTSLDWNVSGQNVLHASATIKFNIT